MSDCIYGGFVKEIIDNLPDNCSAEFFTEDDVAWYSEADVINYLQAMAKEKDKYVATYEPVKLGSCSNCKHYYREVRDGIEYFNFNYCKKGVSPAYPNFFCAYHEEEEEC